MVIKGAMICDANTDQRGDVRIEDGKITAVSRSLILHENEEVLEASNLVLLPGGIDLNTRVSSGILSKNNLLELSKKAACGGVTLALLLPDCKPTLSSELGLELLNALRNDFSAQIVGLAEALNTESKKGLNELALLHKKGAKGIFTQSNIDGNLLRRACEFAQSLNVPMFFTCEDESLSANGVMNDGALSSNLGLPAIPTLSETKEVAKISEVARFMGIKSVFLSIATPHSVELVQQARKTLKKGLQENLHLQTSIHHLMLTEDLCSNYNTAAKIKPPLKSESTRKQLLKLLKTGEITLLTSLQSEQSLTQKDLAFEEAAFGVDMIAYFLPMCYTLLVKNEHLSLKEFSKIISFNPAQALGMHNKGLIAQGYDADLVLLDTKATQVVNDTNSPYCDFIFQSQVKEVFVGGKSVLHCV